MKEVLSSIVPRSTGGSLEIVVIFLSKSTLSSAAFHISLVITSLFMLLNLITGALVSLTNFSGRTAVLP